MEKQSIGKSELAKLYFPDSQEKTASAHLMRWIKRNPDLLEALKAVGYHTHDKYFTPRQRDIIFKYLCEP